MKLQRGTILLVPVIIVAIIAIIGAYLLGKQGVGISFLPQPTVTTGAPEATVIPTATPNISSSPTSGSTSIKPKALVSTSNWQKIEVDKFGISFMIPSGWKVEGLNDKTEEVTISPSSKSPSFSNINILFKDNPKGYGRRDFLWKEVLGYTITLEQGIKNGYVEGPKNWVIDSVESLSLYLKEYSNGGEWMAIPHRGKILLIQKEHAPFTTSDSDTYTFLSTIKLN